MEMTPLLDVIFLLLTFFVFSLVLMVRAEVLGVSLPSLSAADDASGGKAITLTIDAEGMCFLNGEAVAVGGIVDRIKELRSATPEAALLVAADTEGRSGALLEIVDLLSAAGLRDFALVGRPGADPRAPGEASNENAPREGGEIESSSEQPGPPQR